MKYFVLLREVKPIHLSIIH